MGNKQVMCSTLPSYHLAVAIKGECSVEGKEGIYLRDRARLVAPLHG